MRWRAPDGAFAVLAGVSEEGEDVVARRRARPRPRGRVGRRAGRLAAPSAPRLALRGRARPRRGARQRAALLAYLGRSSTSGRAGRRGCSSATAPSTSWPRSTATPSARCARCRASGAARIGAAVRSWEDQGALRAVRLFLEEHGVPAAVAARIYRAYGPGAIETLRSDPYGLTELDGIGFATADALAQALGHPARLPRAPGRRAAPRAPRGRERRPLPPPPRRAGRARAAPARRRRRRPHRRARRPRPAGDRGRPRLRPVDARRRDAAGAPRPRADRRRAAPAPGRDRAPDGRPGPHRRPVGGGARRARAPAGDPHRRPGHGQDA